MSSDTPPYNEEACTHDVGFDGPHQIKGLPRHNDTTRNVVDHATHRRLYAALTATGAQDLSTQYNVLLANAENGRKLRKVIEHYKGVDPLLDELRTLEKNKRAVKKAQQFFAEEP